MTTTALDHMLARLVDFAQATNAILRDVALSQLRVEGRLDRIEERLDRIEDALRGPGRN